MSFYSNCALILKYLKTITLKLKINGSEFALCTRATMSHVYLSILQSGFTISDRIQGNATVHILNYVSNASLDWCISSELL